MNILVTGGAGFIGSHVVDVLLDRGHEVRVLDALVPQVHESPEKRPRYLNARAQLLAGNMLDATAVDRALDGVNSVVHLASAVGVGQSMYQIAAYCKTNVLGTAMLLQSIVDRKTRLRSLVVASSMSVYGEGRYRSATGQLMEPRIRSEAQMKAGDWECHSPDGEPLEPVATSETKPMNPTSVYAVNKRDQEELCLAVGNAYGIPTTALRFFNVYGSRQALSNPYTGVAAIFCARLLNGQPPLIFEDGLQKRDFVHVQDVACAVAAAAEEPAPGEAVNIASGSCVSVLDIARILGREMKKDVEPTIVGKYRRGDIRHCFADISKASQTLAWQPSKTFDQGVPELIDWVKFQKHARDHVGNAWSELETRGLLS